MAPVGPPGSRPSSISGTAAWVRAWAVETLKWNASSRWRALVRTNSRGIDPPTLLTRMSSRPKAARAASARPAAASRSLRSAGTTAARRPAASICLATSTSCDSVRAEITTSAPASASATADAAPMPRPAPVTTATRSVTRNRSRIIVRPLLARCGPLGRTGRTLAVRRRTLAFGNQLRRARCPARRISSGPGRAARAPSGAPQPTAAAPRPSAVLAPPAVGGGRREVGPRRGEQPRREQVVELLAGDLLGQGDELLGGDVPAAVRGRPSRMIAQNASSPTASRRACRVMAPRKYTGFENRSVTPGSPIVTVQNGSSAGKAS